MKHPFLFLGLFLCLSRLCGGETLLIDRKAEAPPHPRLFINAAELATLAARIEDRQYPHILAWERLLDKLDKPPAIRPYVGDNVKVFYNTLQLQSQYARDFALAWWITQDDAYARRAIETMKAWSQATPAPGTFPLMANDGEPIPSTAMYVSRAALPLLYTADLLWEHPDFDPNSKQRFIDWLRQLEQTLKDGIQEWEDNDYYNRQYFNNHLVAHVMGLAAIGSLLDDRELLQFALEHPANARDFAELLEGLILMDGDEVHHRERPSAPPPQDGEIMDRYRQHTARGRGLQYTHLSTALLCATAEIYRAYGVDLWNYTAPGGENLRLPLEFYSDFYRLGNSALKGGFYAGTNKRLGKAGDTPALFELGLARYPDSQPLRNLVWVTDRPIHEGHLLGSTLLTHGIVFPEQAGLQPRPVPPVPEARPADASVLVPAITREHPRLLLDRAGLDAMKQRALSGKAPWTAAWQNLRERADKALSRKALPYVGTDPFAFYRTLLPQAQAARDLALAWWITGDKRYADAARRFLDAWSGASPLPGTGFASDASANSKGMLIPRSTLPMIWAYDILAGGQTLDSREKEAFSAWLRALVPQIKEGARIWKDHDYFDRQYFQNHLAGENMGLIAIAIATGDDELLRYTVNAEENPRDTLDLIGGLILMPGDDVYYREPPGAKAPQAGEIIDRYRHFQMAGHYADYVTYPNRGLQYAMLSANLLGISAQMLEVNGLDLWQYRAPDGENIKLPFVFYAPIYEQMDASAQGGFYTGEGERLTLGGDKRALFEIAAAAYPEETIIYSAIDWPQRSTDTSILLGNEALIFGAGESSIQDNGH